MSFLDDILARKQTEVAQAKRTQTVAMLDERARAHAPPKSLAAALSPHGGPMRVIAEIKRASPSAGVLRAALSAPTLAKTYAAAGAAAISVLTDGPSFNGSLDDLAAVRAAVEVPLLRKDFIVDAYQLHEARAYGADAALLIVAALSDAQLRDLLAAAHGLGLEALVEIHESPELERALAAGARIIGVNNRSLATLAVSLTVGEALLPNIPRSVRAVGESGIHGLQEAQRMRRAGAANLLVGEALVRADDAAALLRSLCAA